MLFLSYRPYLRSDIQVLRGIAVLAVVFFHAKESYFPLGYLGVDVFFVISGFVVTPLILQIFMKDKVTGGGRRLNKLKYFYMKRFMRLAPALAFTLIISAISIFLLGPISDHQRFSRQGIATLLLVGNLGAYRYSGDYFSPNPNPLIHTWSLSVEEQMYILIPLILIIFLHNEKSLKKNTVLVFGVIFSLSFVSFLYPVILRLFYSRAGDDVASQISFYSTIDRAWQFLLGGLAFFLLDRYPNFERIIPKGIHVIAIIAIVTIMFIPFQLNLKVSSIFASLFAVVIILLKSLDLLPNYLIRPLVWVGNRSYSIYLVHMPLIYIAKYSPVTQIGNIENRIVQTILAVSASVMFGSFSYSKIENKFRGRSYCNFLSFKNISAVIILTFLLPLALFVVIDRGVKHSYWGLTEKISHQPYAGTLDPNCMRDSQSGPPCFYETKGAAKTVLLVGDSHAGHISQALVDAAKSTGFNAVVWAHSGCRIQFQKSIEKQVSDNCIYMNNKMKNWVIQNAPEVIIVSQFVRHDSDLDNLKDALSTLRTMVPNILLIENNPVFPDGKDFMVQRPLVMSTYKAPSSFRESEMELRDKNASNQLAIWARNNNISTLDFSSIFCDGEYCTRWSDEGWLYLDADHFSVNGANLTIPQIISYLIQI